MNKKFLAMAFIICFFNTICIAFSYEYFPITQIAVPNQKMQQNTIESNKTPMLEKVQKPKLELPKTDFLYFKLPKLEIQENETTNSTLLQNKTSTPETQSTRQMPLQNEQKIILKGSLEMEEVQTNENVSKTKVVYVTDYRTGYVPKEAQLISKQGVNWNKWSHDAVKVVVDKSLSKLSFDVPMGLTYDVRFLIDNRKQISDFSIEIRPDEENLRVQQDKNALKNLSVFKTELQNLSGSSILAYPKNSIREKTEMYVSFQFVTDTLFVHVANVSPDYQIRQKEGL